MKTLRDIGERAAIERICARLPKRPDVIVGAGDDCAVVRVGGDTDWLLTSDPVIEGVHFLPATPRSAVGHKAVARTLSDIAAMGGKPSWALVDMVAPGPTPVSALDDLYAGAAQTALAHGLAIVGGDLSAGPALEIHVFAVGTVPAGRAILRSGSVPGDRLYVTGSLGGSAEGKHLRFEPRIEQGVWLRDWASSMIDVSDGLASDARHLAKMSGSGCDLNVERIPISSAAVDMKGERSALDHALCDGEDFELLFTVPAERETAFVTAWQQAFDLPCTCIGLMTAPPCEIRCLYGNGNVRPLEVEGFAHFSG